MTEIRFKNIEKVKRNREIEGVTGTELGLADGTKLWLLCASDANPRWVRWQEEFQQEFKRLLRARAKDDRTRAFLARWYHRMFILRWKAFDQDDNEVPFTEENVVAYLIESDDAVPAIQQMVYETQNFRGQNIEAVVDEGKA